MGFPFFTRPPSIPSLPSKPEKIPDKPAQQKTSAFGYLFGGQAKKTVPENKPGFLEGGQFRRHGLLTQEVKKNSYYKAIPGGKKFTEKERVNLITEIEKLGKGSGGLTEKRMEVAIKRLEKEKKVAGWNRNYQSVRELDKKIKQAKEWKKLW